VPAVFIGRATLQNYKIGAGNRIPQVQGVLVFPNTLKFTQSESHARFSKWASTKFLNGTASSQVDFVDGDGKVVDTVKQGK
jgi:hypothetical protein